MGSPKQVISCYICARPLDEAERDTEHVIPKSLFNPEDRENLITLPAHRHCNASFSKDDEYFRLCMTAAAYGDSQAHKLWSGPVLRGFHRPQSSRFKSSVLDKLVPADLHSEAGVYLGSGDAMLQEADRLHRVVNRMVRGLYYLTRRVLPADWPGSSELMHPERAAPFVDLFQVSFRDVGKGTFLFGWKHLADDREGLFWLVFYSAVHFWGYTGDQIRSRLPW